MQVAVQRARYSVLAVAVAATLCPAVSFADADEMPLEEIEVTGSRIARRDFTSASPIVSVPGSLFTETTGLADVKSRRAMREPVTSISSSGISSPSANDTAGHSVAATATANTLHLARCTATGMNPPPAAAMSRPALLHGDSMNTRRQQA